MIFSRRLVLAVSLFTTLVFAPLAASPPEVYQPGQAYFGRNRYIEYLAGDLPVILSAPHGGRERPDELPDREDGTFAFDTNTQELARAIASELHARTGHWPHVIICRLNRRKVDCNREIVEAAAGNPLAEQAWREFQGFIDAAQATVVQQHGRGFYIDLHGHGHPQQRLELGYLHTAEQLAVSDAELSAAPYPSESSLRSIAALGRLPYAELVRGPQSFGALMEKYGFPCSPSPSNPHPQPPFFRGGYNTARHGRDAAPLAGMQIETYSRGVRDTAESRAKFARALANTLETYLAAHLGVSLVPPVSPERKAATQSPAPVPAGSGYVPQQPRWRLFRRLGR
jgi:hypothetical protein